MTYEVGSYFVYSQYSTVILVLAFAHIDFHRDHPEAMMEIRRKTTTSNSSSHASATNHISKNVSNDAWPANGDTSFATSRGKSGERSPQPKVNRSNNRFSSNDVMVDDNLFVPNGNRAERTANVSEGFTTTGRGNTSQKELNELMAIEMRNLSERCEYNHSQVLLLSTY